MSTHRIARVLLAGALVAPAAAAQDEPAGLAGQAAASSGTTNVAQEGFQSTALPEEESTDALQLSVLAGGFLASGNSRSLALTSAADFKLRREVHQLTAAAATNFSRASASPDDPVETTVENYQGRVRYDIFLSKAIAAFLQISARRDRFQGLDVRLNLDPGFAYYFIDRSKHQLWGELGYDLQYDVRRDEALADAEAEGLTLEKSEARHHGRAFAGYDNKLNDAVTFHTGLEYLQGLAPFKDDVTDRVNWRLNWDAGLNSSIAESFSLATTFTLKYDHNPLPGLSKTDTVTAINLVYSIY